MTTPPPPPPPLPQPPPTAPPHRPLFPTPQSPSPASPAHPLHAHDWINSVGDWLYASGGTLIAATAALVAAGTAWCIAQKQIAANQRQMTRQIAANRRDMTRQIEAAAKAGRRAERIEIVAEAYTVALEIFYWSGRGQTFGTPSAKVERDELNKKVYNQMAKLNLYGMQEESKALGEYYRDAEAHLDKREPYKRNLAAAYGETIKTLKKAVED
jgi:hypothetical protein